MRNFRKNICIAIAIFSCLLSVRISAQRTYNLQDAIQTARTNNLYLKVLHYDINLGQADIIKARLRPNPYLNNQTLQVTDTKYFSRNTPWESNHNRQVWWQLTKVFQSPRLRNDKIEYAEQNVQFLEKNYAEAERNLFFEVANKWTELVANQNQVEILQITKTNIDSLVRINESRLKNQVITSTDLIRVQMLSDLIDVQLKQAALKVITDRNNLKFFLVVQDSIVLDVKENFMSIVLPDLDSLMSYSLQSRTDVQTAKKRIDLSNANINLQRALVRPRPELGFIWNPQNAKPYFGFYGTAEIPVFNLNQGARQKSLELKKQAQQNVVDIELRIRTEVKSVYNSFITQRQNLENVKSMVKESDAILNSVRYSYLHGATTIVDFLEAEKSWILIRQQYYQTLMEFQQAYVQVLFTTGMITKL